MADVVNLGNVRTPKHYKKRRAPQEEDCRVLFRFRERNVEWLADYFLGDSQESRGGALSTVMRMKIFLR